MIIKLWDWLFTRKTWTKVNEQEYYYDDNDKLPYKRVWIMKDQFGNIKRVRIS